MVVIQKYQRTVTDVGTDPMDGDLMVHPLCEDAVVGSVIDHQLIEHAGGVIIRRFVSLLSSALSLFGP